MYKYKLRNQLGMTGVTLYRNSKDDWSSVDSGMIDSSLARKENKLLAKHLNKALVEGRKEAIVNLIERLYDVDEELLNDKKLKPILEEWVEEYV